MRKNDREREKQLTRLELTYRLAEEEQGISVQKKLFSILVQRMCTTRIILICKIETKYVAKAK